MVWHLAAIVETSDDAIIGKSLDGTIQSWNSGAERLYGYKAEEVVGRPLALLVPPDRADEFGWIMKGLRLGKRIGNFPHPNTMRVMLMGGNNVLYEQEYYSVGGGFIEWKGYKPPKKNPPKYPFATMKELRQHAAA